MDKQATHGKSTGTRGPTLLHVFARNGWLDLVVDFVGRRGIHPDETPSLEGDKAVAGVPWYTPLFHALAAGHLDVANYLVANGADVTKYVTNLLAPVIQACEIVNFPTVFP